MQRPLRRPLLAAFTAAAVPASLLISNNNHLESGARSSYKATYVARSGPLDRLVDLLDAAVDCIASSGQQLPYADSSNPEYTDAAPTSRIQPLLQQAAADFATAPTSMFPSAAVPLQSHSAAPTTITTSHTHAESIHTAKHQELSAVEIAKQNPADVLKIRRLAEASFGQPLPADRFTDAELMRYAIHCGYTTTKPELERDHALKKGVDAAVNTAKWLQTHQFATEQELKALSHLIRWGEKDSQGRPTLHISIGAAVHECGGRGHAALHFANAVITHMEMAVRDMLLMEKQEEEEKSVGGDDHSTNDNSSSNGVEVKEERVMFPQRVNVIMDASGATALRASRLAWVFKAVASTLNHHYPGRLQELVLANLPMTLRWLVNGVKKLVHPITREKVKVVNDVEF